MVPAGLCCKKPLTRRLKQRFVILLLRSGKKRSQVECCPADLAWLHIPGVDSDPHEGFTHVDLSPDPVLPVACTAWC